MASPTKAGPTIRTRPLVLFGLLSALTFMGPLMIVVVGRGGEHAQWPPDRPIEWSVFLGVTVGFVVLFVGCLLDCWLSLRASRRERAAPESGP